MAPPRVLIAYDGSPHAANAVRSAAALFPTARALIATVPRDPITTAATAFAMVPETSPSLVEQTIGQLDAEARHEAGTTAQHGVDQARALGLDAEVADIPPVSPAWSALLDAAHRLDADLLVCGTRGRGVFTRALLGSTSSSLLHNADVPLLLVPDGDGTLDGPVVAAYDGSDGAARAIEAAGRLLARRMIVVHAWEPVTHHASNMVVRLHLALADRAASTTAAGVDVAAAAGLDAVGDTVEAQDGAWRAVAGAAAAHDAAVIATGTTGLGAARSVLFGSVSSGLVQNAERPILVVPLSR